jgi:hypothetical protein
MVTILKQGQSPMEIVTETIQIEELRQMATLFSGILVKGVVDIRRGYLALDAEMHSDLEKVLLEDGSQQMDLWGINLYPDQTGDGFIEFDSMINMRPSQGNRTRSVEDETTRLRIIEIVNQRVGR